MRAARKAKTPTEHLNSSGIDHSLIKDALRPQQYLQLEMYIDISSALGRVQLHPR
jgi:hypothetical protein